VAQLAEPLHLGRRIVRRTLAGQHDPFAALWRVTRSALSGSRSMSSAASKLRAM
jgi:hypothetical protein